MTAIRDGRRAARDRGRGRRRGRDRARGRRGSTAFEDAIREVTLPLRHEDIIRQQADEKDVPADLIAAVIYAESQLPRPDVVRRRPRPDADHSRDGGGDRATSAAARPSCSRTSPTPTSTSATAPSTCATCSTSTSGNEVAALAAYNAGPGERRRVGGLGARARGHRVPARRASTSRRCSTKRDEYRDNYARRARALRRGRRDRADRLARLPARAASCCGGLRAAARARLPDRLPGAAGRARRLRRDRRGRPASDPRPTRPRSSRRRSRSRSRVLGGGPALSRRLRRAEPWALGCAVAVFAVYGAPVLLSGDATFSGYIKLDDTATWMAFTDRTMEIGRSLDGLAPSSYEATLDLNLVEGLPDGDLRPVGHRRRDHAARTSPGCSSPTGAARRDARAVLWSRSPRRPSRRRGCGRSSRWSRRRRRCSSATALWGGVKEVGGAMLVALRRRARVAAAATRRSGRRAPRCRWRSPPRRCSAMLSVGGALWLAAAARCLALVGDPRARRRARRWRRAAIWVGARRAARRPRCSRSAACCPPTTSSLTEATRARQPARAAQRAAGRSASGRAATSALEPDATWRSPTR